MSDVSVFIESNKEDLQALGLLFARLLQADLMTLSVVPSPVFVAVMSLSENGKLGTQKPVIDLLRELNEVSLDLISTHDGMSILRL
ncbi:hypothetical protein C0584_03160 [Candidatus Parcubacteria bacterium]|nr:MAG: hypothetical protein C0584_03160 [Candidatus Parcubacteria bacterium]